jgi:predicted transposase/invertase (TIGR01784 family)
MSKKEFLPVKSDVIFRLFFADERNMDYLVGFLKSVLKLPEDDYDVIEITDPHLLREYDEDKLAIIDVKLRTKSRKVIHIEIQLSVTPDLRERIIFYDAKLITEQVGSGSGYGVIKQVISIVITDEPLIKNSPRYHHRFTFYDREADVELSDIVEINTLELPKLPKETDGTTLYYWAKFIAAETEEELTMIAERNPQVGKAVVTFRELSADERVRDMYERQERARRDFTSQKKWAVKQREFEIAKNMIIDGKTYEEIAKYTGLTHDEIESLRNEL